MLDAWMKRFCRVGVLTVVYPDGESRRYGDGTGAPVAVRLGRGWPLRLALDPDVGLGEAYMAGGLVIEQGDLWLLMEVIGRNLRTRRRRQSALDRGLARLQRMVHQWNGRTAARRNVAHHYDLSYELYRRFLDADMQYSCAYFSSPDMTLEEAQAAKRAHLAAKLRLSPGVSVLDVGCGWGGLGLELAGRHGARVQGVTLSQEQLAIARRRAHEAGLDEQAQFSLTDYRDVAGPFDRIVSVGMFEHVGAPNFRAYFDQIGRLLKEDGTAVIHTIGRMSPPGIAQPWVRKYIFPGGYIPALSETAAAIEAAGLWITDVEILRDHYAETLRHWRMRFAARRDEIAALYDERFCRMWEFYLAISEMAFRYNRHVVFQIQLAKHGDCLPITRDYMLDEERARAGAARRPSARRAA